jgi:pimeloyl-ACP methyl ester carboxylesterase
VPTRVVVAAGATSTGQLAQRAAAALAEQLGTPLIDFPAGHGGFQSDPDAFAKALLAVLANT